jgi:U3 small nucleolar RNA-associated protein 4
LGEEDEQEADELADGNPGWQKVLDMDLKLQTNLVASAVSSDGKWLAVSDLYETKLFRLQKVRKMAWNNLISGDTDPLILSR